MIILRGRLRGRSPSAGVSQSQAQLAVLAVVQLAQRMASSVTVPVVHGMQEVSGSSPLSSTETSVPPIKMLVCWFAASWAYRSGGPWQVSGNSAGQAGLTGRPISSHTYGHERDDAAG